MFSVKYACSQSLQKSLFVMCKRKASKAPHIPVLAEEVVACLKPKPGQVILDMTFGAGGHSQKLIDSLPTENSEGITILALDRDPLGISYAKSMAEKLKKDRSSSRVIPLHGKFTDLPQLLSAEGYSEGCVDGCLMDCGPSSMQFDTPDRGFSISADAQLDMRMDQSNPKDLNAADLVNTLSKEDLAHILHTYGEERQSRTIAKHIVFARESLGPIKTTRELSLIVAAALTKDDNWDSLGRAAHIATKTFLALRIFVNDELNELEKGVGVAWSWLRREGRMAVISFHSLEDRIVKRIFGGIPTNMPINLSLKQRMALNDEIINSTLETLWSPIVKQALRPTTEEIRQNPRSRSAKLRCASKLMG